MDAKAVRTALVDAARTVAPDCELLRIYWYDGARDGSRPTSEQALIADLDNMKLRLGFINSHGQQKGVDSLIVTDLIELARLQSVSDALLISGDEDTRVGVQIAQNYGVRIHLLGIAPMRGSQSIQLLQEADTTREWARDLVDSFLTIRAVEPTSEVNAAAGTESHTIIQEVVAAYVAMLTASDAAGIWAYFDDGQRGVPPDKDREILGRCRDALARALTQDEKRQMRRIFSQAFSNRHPRNA